MSQPLTAKPAGRAAAWGAGAVGATALGALALGAIAVGSLAIGRLAIGRMRLKRLDVGELTVGRLTVLELKASEDIHLPLQALDYWMRVRWHAERGEFSRKGYFPGIALRSEWPRLVLVAPALSFHPKTETILRYLDPGIDVERIGLAVEWRQGPRVMFRLSGARRPA